MSDVGWAVRAMKNGERVRRAGWPELASHYATSSVATWVFLFHEERTGCMPAVMALRSDGRTCPFVMTDSYLLADDWELA